MSKFLMLPFLFFCQLSFSQNDYDLFQSYNSKFLKKQNSKVISVTEFQESGEALRKIFSYKEFSSAGLPTRLVEYDEDSTEARAVEFAYTSFALPSSINTFEKGKKVITSEFYYDSSKLLRYFKDYVYSSFDGEKMLLWETDFEYYHNKKLKTIIKMAVSDVLPKRDTVERLFFDTSGKKTKSYFNMAGYKHYFIYEWSQDNTEMKEYDYSEDSLQSTIIHKYRGQNEIERIESDRDKPAIFWKYDKENRLIQTNSSLFFTQELFYNPEGYLIRERWIANFPESVKDNDSKMMRFFYEYRFRK